jgi:predicted MFS family arabinose efflux permease
VIVLAALTVSTLALPFAGGVVALSVAGFVFGLMIAPTMINLNTLMQALVPSGRLTEGLAWIACSLGVGISLGSTVAGQLIDRFSHTAGFASVAVGGLVASALAVASVGAVGRGIRSAGGR